MARVRGVVTDGVMSRFQDQVESQGRHIPFSFSGASDGQRRHLVDCGRWRSPGAQNITTLLICTAF